MPKKTKKSEPTVITITLDNDSALLQTASLLIQRGELAKLMQIEYADSADLARAIDNARAALNHIEKFPPQVPDTPSESEQPQAKTTSDEPTVDLPTKGDPTPVKLSHLKIVSGDTDAMAYRRAALIGARLVDSGLWDAGTPIEIHDAHATYQRIRHLDDDALAQMTLADVLQATDDNHQPTLF